MKFFLNIVVLAIFLSACSHQNAFSKFNMDKQEEFSVSNSQTSKIKFKKNIKGVLSAIYLNEVNPSSFHGNEYFYVYLYLKDKNEVNDLNDSIFNNVIKSALTLNGQLPIELRQLPRENEFSHLTSIKNKWNKYYLVTFKKNVKKLNLVFKQGEFSSEVLTYQKEKQ